MKKPREATIGHAITDSLVAVLPRLPSRMQSVAEYILQHPKDLASHSMRGIARRAGVSHTTVLRFSHELGYESYEALQENYISELHREQKIRPMDPKANRGVASIISSLLTNLSSLPNQTTSFIKAADIMATSQEVFCVGLRSQYAAAHQFLYAVASSNRNVVVLDGRAGLESDRLNRSGPNAAMLIISIEPHTPASAELAQIAKARNMRIVAIVDSRSSPIVKLADCVIQVSASKDLRIQSVASSLVATEILAELMLAKAPAAVSQT